MNSNSNIIEGNYTIVKPQWKGQGRYFLLFLVIVSAYYIYAFSAVKPTLGTDALDSKMISVSASARDSHQASIAAEGIVAANEASAIILKEKTAIANERVKTLETLKQLHIQALAE